MERSKGLRGGLVPTQKDLQKHGTFEKRLESNPIKKAEYFQRLMESTGASSIRQLAELTGEDWSYIAKLLRILKLAEPIKEFLLKSQNLTVLKHFHLRRLLKIVNLPEDAQTQCFRKNFEEITTSSDASDGR